MLKFSKAALLLLIVSLPFMKHGFAVDGYQAIATDVFFIFAAGGLTIAVVKGEARIRWDPVYAILLLYFGAMLASLLFAQDSQRGWLKLVTQVYLLSLPLLAASLIETIDDLRSVLLAWLAATAVTATIGAITLLLFALGVEQPGWGYALHEFGTLPPGNYPRIESTFEFPAMLCNYLTISLMILLIAGHFRWISGAAFWLLMAVMGLTALFTLTPGLGGIFLALGVWGFLLFKGRPAAMSLAASTSIALAFLVAATVTPIIHSTAPFLMDVPAVDMKLAPSVRLMTWMDSAKRFLEHPFLGAGIGADAAGVRYVDPSGMTHLLTDAHNVFLNIAAQCGLVGLAAMALLIAYVAKLTGPLRVRQTNLIRVALASAWLIAVVYEGLTGSYEDARHLWLLLGILIAAARLEQASAEPAATRDRVN